MTEKQFKKACSKHFGATPYEANVKKMTVVSAGILYACSAMSGNPRFYDIAQAAI